MKKILSILLLVIFCIVDISVFAQKKNLTKERKMRNKLYADAPLDKNKYVYTEINKQIVNLSEFVFVNKRYVDERYSSNSKNTYNYNVFKYDSVCYMPTSDIAYNLTSPLIAGKVYVFGDVYKVIVMPEEERIENGVYAIGDGIVKYAKNNTVILSHGNGFETVYKYLKNSDVVQNQLITKGQKLGSLYKNNGLGLEIFLEGAPLEVSKILCLNNSRINASKPLYLYKSKDSIYISCNHPMLDCSKTKAVLDSELLFSVRKIVDEHRTERDEYDNGYLDDAIQEEISLEDLQECEPKKQDTVRVRNQIIL
ncbi:MAG: M23 family metallopeptidase [Bacteroidetes bacterium]|nr:M23 family metallopeptidase [Bacteroidota bacterium]